MMIWNLSFWEWIKHYWPMFFGQTVNPVNWDCETEKQYKNFCDKYGEVNAMYNNRIHEDAQKDAHL